MRFLALCLLAATAACSGGDAEIGLDLGVLREHALAAGQRVDAATVVISPAAVGRPQKNVVDLATMTFDLDVPAGVPVVIEASTCIGSSLLCVTNYWGRLAVTPKAGQRGDVIIPAYAAGELLIDVVRADLGAVPADFEIELVALSPRDSELVTFRAKQGERVVLPAGLYRVTTSALSDGTRELSLVNSAAAQLAVGHGSASSATLVFGECVSGVDIDGDGIDCLADCDEASVACGRDCVTDVDHDGTADCRDSCLDADRDVYGEGNGCIGVDCDDSDASRAPDRAEICNGIDDDCDSGTSDASACVDYEGGPRDDSGPIGGDGDDDCQNGGDSVLAPCIDRESGVF